MNILKLFPCCNKIFSKKIKLRGNSQGIGSRSVRYKIKDNNTTIEELNTFQSYSIVSERALNTRKLFNCCE